MTKPGPVYPADLERPVVLPDGTRLRLRPIRPDDAPRLVQMYARLSHHTAYQRFFTVMKRLPPDWAALLATVDYVRRFALVIEHGPAEAPELVAVGRYECEPAGASAEVAFVVQDGWQARGLGSLLLRELLAAAVARGIHRFRAFVLSDNTIMLDLLARFTAIERRHIESGVTELVFTHRRAEAPHG